VTEHLVGVVQYVGNQFIWNVTVGSHGPYTDGGRTLEMQGGYCILYANLSLSLSFFFPLSFWISFYFHLFFLFLSTDTSTAPKNLGIGNHAVVPWTVVNNIMRLTKLVIAWIAGAPETGTGGWPQRHPPKKPTSRGWVQGFLILIN